MEAHLALETERLVAEGLSPKQAAHAAARRFGNRTVAQERFYESRRMLWPDELRQDVRYAWRALLRSPGFTSVAVFTLVLGIGANTAIFSVVNAVLLRPLPYRDPGSLILIETSPFTLSAPWLTQAWRERARSLTELGGFNGPSSSTLIVGAEPSQVDSARVTPNFFSFLGVAPAAGRYFVDGDAVPGAVPVAVITHELWIRQFGGAPDVVGRSVTVDREPVTVVGIAPAGFRFPTGGALPANALPKDTQPDVIRVAAPAASLNIIGRLKPETQPEAARGELLAIFKEEGKSRFPRLVDQLELEAGLLQDRLIGAALLVQTLWNLSVKERGFQTDRLLTVRVAPGLPRNLDQKDRGGQRYFATFFTSLTQQMANVPGITSAAAVSTVPFAGLGAGMGGITVDGQSPMAPEEAVASVAAVSPDYFRTMGIQFAAGRDFHDRDRLGGEMVAIVNDAFRRRFAPNGDLVGSHIRSDQRAIRIVGVVADVPDKTLRDAPEPLMFFPLQQMPMQPFGWGQLRLVLRTEQADPLAMAPTIRRAIWAIDRHIVIDEVATMHERVAATLRSERDSALLFALFAFATLAMAAIGVYGVAAYTIAQRTKEIGIRVALGARRDDVSWLVVSQTLWPTLIGSGVGMAVAFMATRLIASMVYGIEPLDAVTFAATAVVLIGVALAATYGPLRRAVGIDPLVALRYE